jgi:hypothetical protein
MPSNPTAQLHIAIWTDTKDGRKATWYRVTRLKSDPDIGAPAWRLTKHPEATEKEETFYDVIQRPHGVECSCPAGTYGESKGIVECKHAKCLKQVGLLRDRE